MFNSDGKNWHKVSTVVICLVKDYKRKSYYFQFYKQHVNFDDFRIKTVIKILQLIIKNFYLKTHLAHANLRRGDLHKFRA